MFGKSIEYLLHRRGRFGRALRIPPMVTQAISYLDEHSLMQEGLFRVSGQADEVAKYKELYDLEEDVDFSNVGSSHVVSGLLKLWLRYATNPSNPSLELTDMYTISGSFLIHF